MKNLFKRRKRGTSTAKYLEVITDGKTVTFPLSWEGVTLRQFIDFYQAEGNIRKVLEAFASDVDVLHTLDASEEAKLLTHLVYRLELPDFINLPVPTEFEGIEFKNDIGACTLLQKWALDSWLDDDLQEDVNFVNASVQLLAIYLYPVMTGSVLTDLSQAQRPEIIKRIESLPCLSALALAGFFLSRYASPTESGASTYNTVSRPLPSWPQQKPWYQRWMSILSLNRSMPLPQSAI